MKKTRVIILILCFIFVGCNVDNSELEGSTSVSETANEDFVSNEKQETVKEKESDKKADNNQTSSSSQSASKKENTNSSSKSQSTSKSTSDATDKSTNSNSQTKQTTPKEETQVPLESVKKWAMSEAEMIAYARQCVTNYKPTSGYGHCEWAENFNKDNSGWFAPITIKITDSKYEIESLISGKIHSTLRKATSQIYDDGQGNIRLDIKYPAKGYLEKVNEEQYMFYVFY